MQQYDLIVIGAGPGGYPAAAAGVKAGLRTLLVEERELGGTCLNRGCIPTKAFCRSAETAMEIADAANFGIIPVDNTVRVDMDRVVQRKNEIVLQLRESVAGVIAGADVCLGRARFTGPKTIEVAGQEFTAAKIVVATGARPAMLDIPGADLCVTSDTLLDATSVPESLAIIGGGVIGMEFASIFSALGSKVTVVEYCKEILPGFDQDIAKRLRTAMTRRGVKFHTSAAATAVRSAENGSLTLEFTAKGKTLNLEASTVLMAVGRKPVAPEGLADAGAEVGPKGIKVDENFMTAVNGVYAIGDCNGLCQLAHAATAQSRRVMGLESDLSPIPATVFTVPEVASTGLTEQQATEKYPNCRVAKLPMRSNGKALTLGSPDGLAKVIVANVDGTDRIVGCHIIGPHASDLIMEASLAISASLPTSAVAKAIHPHPTLSELLHTAVDRL